MPIIKIDTYWDRANRQGGWFLNSQIIKALHKRYGDSTLTRAFARVYEIGVLLKYLKELLNKIDLSLPSLTHQLPKIKNFSGIGVVEASRGSLIHKISVRNSKIIDYEIITPTQWNIPTEMVE